MVRNVEVVTKKAVPGRKRQDPRLPKEYSEGAVLLEWLTRQGIWDEITQRFRVNRKAGGYVALDLVLFLLFYFTFPQRLSLKNFGARTAPQRRKLGALGGRKSLATPASLSRGLQHVSPTQVRALMPWLLIEACDAREVLRHPATADYDTQGRPWSVFDWDGTRKGIRQRALVDGAAYPTAERLGTQLGKPGYTGRKRGELVLGRAVLSHTGSGLWIYEHQTAGHAETVEGLSDALDALDQVLNYAQLPHQRTVLRYDGGGGNVPSLSAIRSRNITPLVRLATYTLLKDPDVVQTLQRAQWVEVPCSGSGPTRQATDLGIVRVVPSSKTRNKDNKPYEPVDIRVVVSRFACPEGKSGTGHEIDGYQYELFATDLPNASWPAPEVVTLYYGREGEENRFAQEDRELQLDRIFSKTPGGQYLATLVGLWTWNLQICHGYALDPPEPKKPKLSPRQEISAAESAGTRASAPRTSALPVHQRDTEANTMAVASVVAPVDNEDQATPVAGCLAANTDTTVPGRQDNADTQGPPAGVRATDDEPGAHVADEVRPILEQAIGELKASEGWHVGDDGLSLKCPQQHPLWLGRVKRPTETSAAAIRMQASVSTCGPCPQRAQCGRVLSQRFAKEVTIKIPANLADKLCAFVKEERTRRYWANRKPTPAAVASTSSPTQRPKLGRTHVVEPPPRDIHPGPLATHPPVLSPAVLRQAFRQMASQIDIEVSVHMAQVRREHPAIARSPAARQRRRQSWLQQGEHKALPVGSRVDVRYQDSSRGLEPWLAQTLLTGKKETQVCAT